MIRPARPGDLDALVALENACFQTDRLSRRSLRHLLTRARAVTLVDEDDSGIRGYVTVLFHAATSLARIYSIAVSARARGRGIGSRLVEAAEKEALEHDRAWMRLEVRRDNAASLALFRRLGYRQFGSFADYYEDHEEAVRLEKPLTPVKPERTSTPYYRQTLDFTCGPASLMMAMGRVTGDLETDRALELRLWRESTTVFMTSGHGGCGPHGLALAAARRGFGVDMYVSEDNPLFVDSVRSAEKKEVIRLVHEDFLRQLEKTNVRIHHRRLDLGEMKAQMERGAVPMVLISSYRIYHEKAPHWVVVSGLDEHFIYVHDPFVDQDKGKSETDVYNMPIPQREFARMARYGKSGLRAALVLHPESHP